MNKKVVVPTPEDLYQAARAKKESARRAYEQAVKDENDAWKLCHDYRTKNGVSAY